jgi:hypothetical protein
MVALDRVGWLWSRPNKLLSASLNSIVSSSLLNEFTFSMNSDDKGTIDMWPDCGARCDRATYGVTYPYLFPGTKLANEKIPTIRITGLSALDSGPYPGAWGGFVYTWADNLTKVVGNHTTKFGVVIERSGQNDFIQFTTASQGTTNTQNGEVRFLDAWRSPTPSWATSMTIPSSAPRRTRRGSRRRSMRTRRTRGRPHPR